MTNVQHNDIKTAIARSSLEDLYIIKHLVETECIQRDSLNPDFRKWAERLNEEINRPTKLTVIEGGLK